MNNYHLKLEASWDEVKERIKEVNAEITDADWCMNRAGKKNF